MPAFATRGRIAYLGAGLALTLVLLFAVPKLTPSVPPLAGYAGVLVVYWLAFCLPVFLALVPADRRWALFSPALERGQLWVPYAVLVQVALIGVGALSPVIGDIAIGGVALAAALAVCNGVFEEAAWRGAALAVFGEHRAAGLAAGLVLFTLWHVPLALVAGVAYPGGPAMLIGGAFALGAFWSVVSWTTGRIGWPVIAHVATNFLAFTALAAHNGWGAS